MTRESTPASSPRSADGARSREYSRAKLALFIIGAAFSLITSIIFAFSGASSNVSRASIRRFRHAGVSETATIGGFLMLSWLASLPLSYIRGYWLEHRYELSNHTRASWLGDQLKALALELTLAVPIARGALAVIRRRPRDWWLVLSALAVPFTVILSQLAPVLIMPLFNTYRPLRDQDLAERIRALAARSGIEVAEVLEVDMSRQTKKANAFFTGLGRTKRIVLSDTLIEEFTPEQIETVVAHEIAHQAHGDIWRLIAVGSVTTTAVAFVTHRLVHAALKTAAARRAGLNSPGDVASLPLLGAVGSVAGLLLMPLQNAHSRYIERRADTYALELTDNPESYAAALNKLGEMNLTEIDPPKLEQVLLHSHPSIKDRIDRCEEFAGAR
jgi:STE24 endopeptidase